MLEHQGGHQVSQARAGELVRTVVGLGLARKLVQSSLVGGIHVLTLRGQNGLLGQVVSGQNGQVITVYVGGEVINVLPWEQHLVRDFDDVVSVWILANSRLSPTTNPQEERGKLLKLLCACSGSVGLNHTTNPLIGGEVVVVDVTPKGT